MYSPEVDYSQVSIWLLVPSWGDLPLLHREEEERKETESPTWGCSSVASTFLHPAEEGSSGKSSGYFSAKKKKKTASTGRVLPGSPSSRSAPPRMRRRGATPTLHRCKREGVVTVEREWYLQSRRKLRQSRFLQVHISNLTFRRAPGFDRWSFK